MFSTHPIRVVPRDPVLFLDPDVQRGEPLLTICSWCMKVRLPNQGWVELEEVVNYLDILGSGMVPSLTHGVCRECQGDIEKELKILK